MSIVPKVEWASSKAAVMEDWEERSPGAMRTCVEGKRALMVDLVWERVTSVRPTRAMRGAPALAKERAMAAPMPEPPPVTRMVLLAAEREGRMGLMAG